jgi:hypothetical protein
MSKKPANVQHADYTAKWKVIRWKSVNPGAFFVTNPLGSSELKLDERFGLLATVGNSAAQNS